MERNTRQRAAIRGAFESTRRPLGPAEVLALAQREMGRLGIATVYRTIKALVEEGWLVAVDLPGAPHRYEPAGLEHHHHPVARAASEMVRSQRLRKGAPRSGAAAVPARTTRAGAARPMQ